MSLEIFWNIKNFENGADCWLLAAALCRGFHEYSDGLTLAGGLTPPADLQTMLPSAVMLAGTAFKETLAGFY